MSNWITTIGWKICQFFGLGQSHPSAQIANEKPPRAKNSKRSKLGHLANLGKPKDEGEKRSLAMSTTSSDMPARKSAAHRSMPENIETTDRTIDREATSPEFQRFASNSGQPGQIPTHDPTMVKAQVALQDAARIATERHHQAWVIRSRFQSAVEQVEYKVGMMATAAASPEQKWNAKKVASLRKQAQASIEEIEYHNQQWIKIFGEHQERQETLQLLLIQFCNSLQTAHGTGNTKHVPAAHTRSSQPLPEAATRYDIPRNTPGNSKDVENPVNVEIKSCPTRRISESSHAASQPAHTSRQLNKGITTNAGPANSYHGDQVYVASDPSKLRLPSAHSYEPITEPRRPLCDPLLVTYDYAAAKHRLALARWHFEHQEQKEKELREEFGHEVPKEVLDLFWVEGLAKLTRDVVDAEQEFRKAKLHALNNHCKVADSEASSLFPDHDSDGYSPSVERNWVANHVMPRELVDEWRHKIDPSRRRQELDAPSIELDLEEDELVPWDSASAVAEPNCKANIEKWEKISASLGKMPVGDDHSAEMNGVE